MGLVVLLRLVVRLLKLLAPRLEQRYLLTEIIFYRFRFLYVGLLLVSQLREGCLVLIKLSLLVCGFLRQLLELRVKAVHAGLLPCQLSFYVVPDGADGRILRGHLLRHVVVIRRNALGHLLFDVSLIVALLHLHVLFEVVEQLNVPALEYANLVFHLIHHGQRSVHSRVQLSGVQGRLASDRLDVAIDLMRFGCQHYLRVDRLAQSVHFAGARRDQIVYHVEEVLYALFNGRTHGSPFFGRNLRPFFHRSGSICFLAHSPE